MVDRFKAIQAKHGPESVAFLGTGQIATEEMALLGALAKFGMGMVHGDGNTRQCMATAVVAYKQAFGFDAPPYTYADFEESDVHRPRRLEPLHRPPDHVGARLPQPARARDHRHRSAQDRDGDGRDAAPRRCGPSRDLVLLYGLAQPADRARLDRPRVHRRAHHRLRRVRRARRAVHARARRRRRPGSPSTAIERARGARSTSGKRVSFWWTMGVNQSHEGVRTAQAIINLALMTGNIGRPGTGANSITGQCNAMGSRLFSNTTNLLGGRDFADAEHRAEGRRRPRHRRERASRREPSWAYDQIIEGILRGQDPGPLGRSPPTRRTPGSTRTTLREMLGRLDFLVVQDMYATTETARSAPTWCCPPPAGARRRARSSTPSGASA